MLNFNSKYALLYFITNIILAAVMWALIQFGLTPGQIWSFVHFPDVAFTNWERSNTVLYAIYFIGTILIALFCVRPRGTPNPTLNNEAKIRVVYCHAGLLLLCIALLSWLLVEVFSGGEIISWLGFFGGYHLPRMAASAAAHIILSIFYIDRCTDKPAEKLN